MQECVDSKQIRAFHTLSPMSTLKRRKSTCLVFFKKFKPYLFHHLGCWQLEIVLLFHHLRFSISENFEQFWCS